MFLNISLFFNTSFPKNVQVITLPNPLVAKPRHRGRKVFKKMTRSFTGKILITESDSIKI